MGLSLGDIVGDRDGDIEGVCDGDSDGDMDGLLEGLNDGDALGDTLGDIVGDIVGDSVGARTSLSSGQCRMQVSGLARSRSVRLSKWCTSMPRSECSQDDAVAVVSGTRRVARTVPSAALVSLQYVPEAPMGTLVSLQRCTRPAAVSNPPAA